MILTPDMKTLRQQMASFGCTIDFQRTGHKMYQRGFITDPRGIQVGRAVIHGGELSHIKWYSGADYKTNHGMPLRLQWLKQYGVMVTPREWYDEVIPAAMRAQARDTAHRKEQRRKREENDLKLYKRIKKRRSIQGRDLAMFILPPAKILHNEELPPLAPEYVPEDYPRSKTTGKVICACGKGYGSEQDGKCGYCRGNKKRWCN
ncbi:hypothetical protein pD_gene0048 [Vibrio phage 033B]|nr:hypothetical protein pD_gene0048 [Vibrio phage 033B]